MSYTGIEAFNASIAIIDELSDSGQVSDSQIKEYKYRAPYLLDLWQGEINKSGDNFKTFEIDCFRKVNNLGDLGQFQAVEFTGTDQPYTTNKPSNCFYVEVDEDCTVKFTENGNPLSGIYIFNSGTPTAFTGTINITVPVGNKSFLSLKGILNPSSQSSNISMVMSGTYYYRHTNRALCPYKYSSAAKVPDFKPWFKVTMPDDFKSKTQVVSEYPSWQYEIDSDVKWENGNQMYIQFSFEGIKRINYIPLPGKITSLTQTIEADEITARSAPWYLAKMFALADQNTELANVCSAKYKELKAESMIKEPLANVEIIDFYS